MSKALTILKTIAMYQDIKMLAFLERTKFNEEYRKELRGKIIDELKEINETAE